MFILEFETDAPTLEATREAVSEMELEYETERRSTRTDQVRMMFRASGGDFEAFESALAADPSVETATRISDGDGSRIYRITYSDEASRLTPFDRTVDLDITVVEARTTDDGWWVRARFPTQNALRELKSWYDERGLSFRIKKLYSGGPSSDETHGVELTEKQLEALQHAYDAGYFGVPRQKTLNNLAAELGISDAALSNRLRRATNAVLEYHLESNPEKER